MLLQPWTSSSSSSQDVETSVLTCCLYTYRHLGQERSSSTPSSFWPVALMVPHLWPRSFSSVSPVLCHVVLGRPLLFFPSSRGALGVTVLLMESPSFQSYNTADPSHATPSRDQGGHVPSHATLLCDKCGHVFLVASGWRVPFWW